MKTLLTMDQESELISQEYGLYVSPYKLNMMSATAEKVAALIVKAYPGMTYQMCEIVLALAAQRLKPPKMKAPLPVDETDKGK